MFEKVFSKAGLDLPHETLQRLKIYYTLLLKWQKVINLVSHATMDEAVMRHFVDSAQLFLHIPNKDIIMVDMGSGAGFPGLVLAIMGVKEVHLIESDVRKATFLREVSRETLGGGDSGISVIIHDERIEDVSIPNVDLVTARALATLVDLFAMADTISTEGHKFQCLFLKGEKAERELDKAKKKWNFDVSLHQSLTDITGKVVEINNLLPKHK